MEEKNNKIIIVENEEDPQKLNKILEVPNKSIIESQRVTSLH